jgi:hypothetical protein
MEGRYYFRVLITCIKEDLDIGKKKPSPKRLKGATWSIGI